MKNEENTCQACRHYYRRFSECRRFPPQVVYIELDDSTSEFPHVGHDDWCGELKYNELWKIELDKDNQNT